MSWYAVDAVDDAIGATRTFLGGASLWRWARLAAITLLLGTGGVGGQFSNLSNVPGLSPGERPSPTLPSTDPGLVEFGGPDVWLLVAVVVILIGVWLLFDVVGAVMEFVFLAALSTDEVRIRAPFRRHTGDGLRLFGFRLAVTLPVATPVLVGVAAVLGGVVSPAAVGAVGVVAVVAVVAGLAFVSGLVRSLTNQFVVPVMFDEGRGVVDAWRRLWPLLRGEGWQTVVYVVVHLLVGIGVGIVRTFLLVVGAIPATILAAAVGLVVGALGGGLAGPLGVGLGFVAGGVTWLLAMLVVLLPINAVSKTYTRAFELRSLAGFDDDLAVLSPSLVPPTTRSGPPPGSTRSRDDTEYVDVDDLDERESGDDTEYGDDTDDDRWA